MIDNIKLKSGVSIPSIGFGPGIMGYSAKMKKKRGPISTFIWKVYNKLVLRPSQKKKFVQSIAKAFNNGFRLLDYSNAYGNQELIAKSITKAGITQKDLFLTSRISNQAQFKGRVREEFFETLNKWGG